MKIKIKHLIVFVILISFLASYFFPGIGDDPRVQNSITFIGILFGIIVGFFIADLYSRYQGIRDNAGTEVSALRGFYLFSKVLAKENNKKKWLKEVEIRINNYIRKFMPLQWENYSETEKEFIELNKSIEEIQYEGSKSAETFASLLDAHSKHSDARENLVMFGKDKLSWGEWLTTLFLGGLLLVSLFYTKDTSLISTLFTGAITSAILLLFIVLRDLNNLNFGENAVSIEPYERVLDAIGKPRYYKTKRRAVI
jgi:ABC-type multidrug transport system fused ATPase/permease subunit